MRRKGGRRFSKCISCCYGFRLFFFLSIWVGIFFVSEYPPCILIWLFFMLDFVWKIQSNYLFALNFGYFSAAYSYPPQSAKNVSTFDLINPSPWQLWMKAPTNTCSFVIKSHLSYCAVVIDKTIPVFIKVSVWSVYLIIWHNSLTYDNFGSYQIVSRKFLHAALHPRYRNLQLLNFVSCLLLDSSTISFLQASFEVFLGLLLPLLPQVSISKPP